VDIRGFSRDLIFENLCVKERNLIIFIRLCHRFGGPLGKCWPGGPVAGPGYGLTSSLATLEYVTPIHDI